MNVKVTGDDKFMVSGCSKGEKVTRTMKNPEQKWVVV